MSWALHHGSRMLPCLMWNGRYSLHIYGACAMLLCIGGYGGDDILGYRQGISRSFYMHVTMGIQLKTKMTRKQPDE